jgi:hypothetical protein
MARFAAISAWAEADPRRAARSQRPIQEPRRERRNRGIALLRIALQVFSARS